MMIDGRDPGGARFRSQCWEGLREPKGGRSPYVGFFFLGLTFGGACNHGDRGVGGLFLVLRGGRGLGQLGKLTSGSKGLLSGLSLNPPPPPPPQLGRIFALSLPNRGGPRPQKKKRKQKNAPTSQGGFSKWGGGGGVKGRGGAGKPPLPVMRVFSIVAMTRV